MKMCKLLKSILAFRMKQISWFLENTLAKLRYSGLLQFHHQNFTMVGYCYVYKMITAAHCTDSDGQINPKTAIYSYLLLFEKL